MKIDMHIKNISPATKNTLANANKKWGGSWIINCFANFFAKTAKNEH